MCLEEKWGRVGEFTGCDYFSGLSECQLDLPFDEHLFAHSRTLIVKFREGRAKDMGRLAVSIEPLLGIYRCRVKGTGN